MINPETVTVILTPHSADTYGLAVVEKTAEGIRVRELRGGRGNFGFDYEVKGVRKGYEDYRVIRDASEMTPGGREPVNSISDEEETDEEIERESDQEVKIGLEQNQPNPFSDNTSIRYTIPESVQKAELYIFDAAGKQLQKHILSPGKEGMLDISGNTLAPGMYNYSLFIDGELHQTRKMIIAK